VSQLGPSQPFVLTHPWHIHFVAGSDNSPKQRPEEGKATYTGDMMLAHRVAAPFENTIFERSDKDIE
jgi:hypothetical protein